MTPGIYPGLPMAQYLAIPALSAGVIKVADDKCMAAAWHESAFNPQREADDTDASDLGSIAHAILLEGSEACCKIIDPALYPAKNGNIPDGWTNPGIRAARDEARAAGLIPLLPGAINGARAMHKAAQTYIASLRETEPAVWEMFAPGGGDSEVTMVWEENGLLCKLRIDKVATDYSLMCDYKTSAQSVEPSSFARTQMANMGHFVTAAWYRRGVVALVGDVDPPYLFLAQESTAPYLCSLNACDPSLLAIGDQKIDRALGKWRKCVASGSWPGYPNRIAYAEPPAWMMAQEAEKELIDYRSQA